jgi:hypothetical protein
VTPDDAEYLNYAARNIITIHLPLLKPQVARMLAEL